MSYSEALGAVRSGLQAEALAEALLERLGKYDIHCVNWNMPVIPST